jgi:hypothetical protein
VIVVGVRAPAHLLIPGRHTGSVEILLEADPQWAAPRLWRSELRNILLGVSVARNPPNALRCEGVLETTNGHDEVERRAGDAADF